MLRALKKSLELGYHKFDFYYPDKDVPYPDTTMVYFCTNIGIGAAWFDQMPSNARVFVDGVCKGTIEELFEEEK